MFYSLSASCKISISEVLGFGKFELSPVYDNLTPFDMYNGLSQVYCIKPEGRIQIVNKGLTFYGGLLTFAMGRDNKQTGELVSCHSAYCCILLLSCQPCPEVMKLFSCSPQLSKKIQLLKKAKIPVK